MATLEEILGIGTSQPQQQEVDVPLRLEDIIGTPVPQQLETPKISYTDVKARIQEETDQVREAGLVPHFTDDLEASLHPGGIYISPEDEQALSPAAGRATPTEVKFPKFEAETDDPIQLAEDYANYEAKYEAALNQSVRNLRSTTEPFELTLAKETADYARQLGGADSPAFLAQQRELNAVDELHKKNVAQKAKEDFAEQYLELEKIKNKKKTLERNAALDMNRQAAAFGRLDIATELTGGVKESSLQVDSTINDLGFNAQADRIAAAKGVPSAIERLQYAKDKENRTTTDPARAYAQGKLDYADIAFKDIREELADSTDIEDMMKSVYTGAKQKAEQDYLKTNFKNLEVNPKLVAAAKAPGGIISVNTGKLFNIELQNQTRTLATKNVFEDVDNTFIVDKAPAEDTELLLRVFEEAKANTKDTPLQAIKVAAIAIGAELQEQARSQRLPIDPAAITETLKKTNNFLANAYTQHFNHKYAKAGLALDPGYFKAKIERSIPEIIFGL